MINISKAIVFFDIESTGLSTTEDRIIELGCVKIHPDGTREEKSIIVNPTIPIPIESSDVHGITNEQVKKLPTFKQFSKGVYDFIYGCNLGGFNSDAFDIPLLHNELIRSGLPGITWDFESIDIRRIYMMMYPNNLSSIYERLTGKELVGAHGAVADINATIEILSLLVGDAPIESMPNQYNNGSVKFDIDGKFYIKDDNLYWNFGKNKDKIVKEHDDYTEWFLEESNFNKDLKLKVIKYLEKKSN